MCVAIDAFQHDKTFIPNQRHFGTSRLRAHYISVVMVLDTQWTLNGHSMDTTMDTTMDTMNYHIKRARVIK